MTDKPKSTPIQPRLTPLTPSYFDKLLSATINFTEDELEANRHGYLYAGQAQRKWWGFVSDSWFITIIGGFVGIPLALLILGWLIIAIIAVVITDSLGTAEKLAGAGIFGFMLLGLLTNVFESIARFMKIRSELKAGIVDYSAGQLTIQGNYGRNSVPEVHMNNRVYYLPKSAKKKLKDGDNYILYHLPESRIVLSAEPLSS